MQTEIATPRLRIRYERSGPSGGRPLILVHGWPDTLRTWDGVLSPLHAAGFETIVPSLRSYGGTVFLDPDTLRSGETVALARDILDLADVLGISAFGLAGHDWGARALFDACILAPERIDFAVALSLGWKPAAAGITPSWHQKQAFWYQWYLGAEHGAAAFRSDPEGFCKHLWDTWSPPGWYADDDWRQAAEAFAGADWCDVVVHYYRARWGQAEPDPFYAGERAIANSATAILTPTMVIHGLADGCCLPELSENCASYFPNGFARETLEGVGHFPQRETPSEVAGFIMAWAETQNGAPNT
ncbi:MAG TPA: alpha/beta hydrolase [Hyphomicrobiaceae bacterium]|nr:alpha/beta hydrolase [Hyphomicrobiaceae bacterium]